MSKRQKTFKLYFMSHICFQEGRGRKALILRHLQAVVFSAILFSIFPAHIKTVQRYIFMNFPHDRSERQWTRVNSDWRGSGSVTPERGTVKFILAKKLGDIVGASVLTIMLPPSSCPCEIDRGLTLTRMFESLKCIPKKRGTTGVSYVEVFERTETPFNVNLFIDWSVVKTALLQY